jgi:hypothetical protein
MTPPKAAQCFISSKLRIDVNAFRIIPQAFFSFRTNFVLQQDRDQLYGIFQAGPLMR